MLSVLCLLAQNRFASMLGLEGSTSWKRYMWNAIPLSDTAAQLHPERAGRETSQLAAMSLCV